MFRQLLLIELHKIRKHPAVWIQAGVLLIIFSAFFLIRYSPIGEIAKEGTANSNGLEKDLTSVIVFFNLIEVLFYATIAALIVAYDYQDRSIQMWLMRGVPRTNLLLTRLITLILFTLLFIIFWFGLVLILGTTSRFLFLGNINIENMNWGQLPLAILRIFAGALPYVFLTALLSIISRSPIFAAAGTFIFRSVIESLLGRLGDNYPIIIKFLPSQMASVLQLKTLSLDLTAPPINIASIYNSELQIVIAIGLIVVIFTGLSLLVFSRQDLGN